MFEDYPAFWLFVVIALVTVLRELRAARRKAKAAPPAKAPDDYKFSDPA